MNVLNMTDCKHWPESLPLHLDHICIDQPLKILWLDAHSPGNVPSSQQKTVIEERAENVFHYLGFIKPFLCGDRNLLPFKHFSILIWGTFTIPKVLVRMVFENFLSAI